MPPLEFNYEGGRKALENKMSQSRESEKLYTMPEKPGIS